MPDALDTFPIHREKVAVQFSKRKSQSGRRYKERVRSLSKAKKSDPSQQKKSEPSQSEINATEPKGSGECKTTYEDASVSHSQQERMHFVLRRLKRSRDAEKSNFSNHATQTKKRKNNVLERECNEDGTKLQEKLKHSVADEHNSTTTNFVEYWVPVRLSNVQTEQYCGCLFSNSSFLCSSSRHDPKDHLHEILVTTRKCCDHPYLVDPSIRNSLVQGILQSEHYDEEIKLSSKLQLLHKILLEINKRGLRVLILYQSFGSPGQFSTRDILDDIIHEKFGEDSFVHFDGGKLSRSKRKEVLNTFNDKKNGKFACLMETRACVPSIELKSLDTVVMFNSNWDPMTDFRALQRMNLDSQFDQVKVFRLYSAYTVEEKLLMLAKQGMAPEVNLVNVKRETCHGLLTWGAYYLFERLDEFLSSDTQISRGDSSIEDVFLEVSALLPKNDENSLHTENPLILEVEQIGGVYAGNISLLGEVEYPRMDNFSLVEEMMDEAPCELWINLLQGRKPRWKYYSSQSPRNRKCVQQSDDVLAASVGASNQCRIEAKMRSLGELQDRDKITKLPGESAVLTLRQTPMLGNPSSTESHSLVNEEALTSPLSQLPSDSRNQTPIQNDRLTGQRVEDAVRQTVDLGSKMRGKKRRARATNVPLNGQPPETSHLMRSKMLQFVCNALDKELEGLENQKTEFLKQHEDMKLQTKMACEKEIDEVKKKYELMLQNAETAFVEETRALESRHKKAVINKSLAEVMLQMVNSTNATLSQEVSSSTDCSVPLQETIASMPNQCLSSPTYPVASQGLHFPTGQLGPIRAPAPHLRPVRDSPQPFTAAILPSQGPKIAYSPVSLVPVTSKVQTRPSLECPSSSRAGFAAT